MKIRSIIIIALSLVLIVGAITNIFTKTAGFITKIDKQEGGGTLVCSIDDFSNSDCLYIYNPSVEDVPNTDLCYQYTIGEKLRYSQVGGSYNANGSDLGEVFHETYLQLGKKCGSFEEYAVTMIDFDIYFDLRCLGDIELRFLPASVCSVYGGDKELGYSNCGVNYISYENGKIGEKSIGNIDGNFNLHFTFLIDPNGCMMTYVNGEYYGLIEQSDSSFSSYENHGILIETYVKSPCGSEDDTVIPELSDWEVGGASFDYSIDNFYMSTFPIDYDGALMDLIDDPNMELSANPDTYYGGCYED